MNLPTTQSAALDALARRALSHHRARAKAVGQVLDYGLDHLARLVGDNPACRWCRMPVSFGDLQVDHLMPTSRGGAHSLYNLCVACKRCNALRGMLSQAETEHLLEFLDSMPAVARQDLERRLLSGGARYSRSCRR